MDNPPPTEEEQEHTPERLRDEENMRYPDHGESDEPAEEPATDEDE